MLSALQGLIGDSWVLLPKSRSISCRLRCYSLALFLIAFTSALRKFALFLSTPAGALSKACAILIDSRRRFVESLRYFLAAPAGALPKARVIFAGSP